MMKQNIYGYAPSYTYQRVQGFTLIEFLVASMLAMIVIVAAGSTYMITRKLNSAVQERIAVQQDIRNASVQMARDARMAGSFGCFNTSDVSIAGKSKVFKTVKAKDAKVAGIVELNNSNNDGFGVRLIKSAQLKSLGLPGLSQPSNGLLFIYGQSTVGVQSDDLSNGTSGGSHISTLKNLSIQDQSNELYQALVKKGDVVLSTCATFDTLSVKQYIPKQGQVNIHSKNFDAYVNNSGELSLSKLHASLYVLGSINRGKQTQWGNEKALLRYDLGADGTWQNSQLLVTGIDDRDNQGMKVSFGYVDETKGCKDGATDKDNSEEFIFVDTPANGDSRLKKLPALVQVRLKYFTNQATGKQADAQTRDYIINTTVRGGNTCVNRLVSSKE